MPAFQLPSGDRRAGSTREDAMLEVAGEKKIDRPRHIEFIIDLY